MLLAEKMNGNTRETLIDDTCQMNTFGPKYSQATEILNQIFVNISV
jgi:hypothetical protein